MQTATLSSKFQISIPKAIRENLHLKAGQKFVFITKGNIIYLVPQMKLSDAQGLFEAANTKVIVTAGTECDLSCRYLWMARMVNKGGAWYLNLHLI